jgi:hypothetical protein
MDPRLIRFIQNTVSSGKDSVAGSCERRDEHSKFPKREVISSLASYQGKQLLSLLCGKLNYKILI